MARVWAPRAESRRRQRSHGIRAIAGRIRASHKGERPGLAAVILSVDEAAGLATQASAAILEAPEGQRFLTDGYMALGRHLAAELLR